MFTNRNSYLSIVAMALIQCICFSVMAEPAQKTYPLSLDDPEAQIDASYLDIPAIVPPSPDQWGKAPRRKAQGLKAYDVKAGQERGTSPQPSPCPKTSLFITTLSHPFTYILALAFSPLLSWISRL